MRRPPAAEPPDRQRARAAIRPQQRSVLVRRRVLSRSPGFSRRRPRGGCPAPTSPASLPTDLSLRHLANLGGASPTREPSARVGAPLRLGPPARSTRPIAVLGAGGGCARRRQPREKPPCTHTCPSGCHARPSLSEAGAGPRTVGDRTRSRRDRPGTPNRPPPIWPPTGAQQATGRVGETDVPPPPDPRAPATRTRAPRTLSSVGASRPTGGTHRSGPVPGE